MVKKSEEVERPDGHYLLLSVKQLAVRTSLSESSIKNLIYSGTLQPVRMGSRLAVRESTLREHLDSLDASIAEV